MQLPQQLDYGLLEFAAPPEASLDSSAEILRCLITSLPSEGASDSRQRTVIISGLNSAGTQAAAEFFASPHHLQALQEKLRTAGHRRFPDARQVLIKTTSDATLPLSYGYVAHRVLSRWHPS